MRICFMQQSNETTEQYRTERNSKTIHAQHPKMTRRPLPSGGTTTSAGQTATEQQK